MRLMKTYRQCCQKNINCSEQNGPTSQASTDAFVNAKQKAQKKLLVIQDAWYSKKTDEIQSYADRH